MSDETPNQPAIEPPSQPAPLNVDLVVYDIVEKGANPEGYETRDITPNETK